MSGAEGTKENRRQARVQAVQHLYGREMRGALATADEKAESAEEISVFARDLLDQSAARIEEIDKLLAAALQNWDLKRLGAVDRAVLRVAVAEMLAHPDLPAAVTINEAIEIARSLGSAESARFANGVLDRVRKEMGRDPRATA
ncbi:MAG: transcription antitermination factor NusB [Chthoniobacterales bacterium]